MDVLSQVSDEEQLRLVQSLLLLLLLQEGLIMIA
jgi:hypothetical protein